MERIPILKVHDFLLVSIQVEMHDTLALALQEDLTHKLYQTKARGVLIDISTVDVLDSFMARVLRTIVSSIRIMGSETVIVGMQPAVAITLIEMGITLPEVLTAISVEKGMRMLGNRLGYSNETDEAGGFGS
jgi:rsbT antagonist protein RsbS